MKTMGIVVIVTGLLITVYTGFGFITKPKELNVSHLEVTRNKGYGLGWSPVIGVFVIAVGGALLMLIPRKN
ncbi:MAG: hypothetical protein K2Q22_12680 [Cytophagales bacterium]|nr:hypothetical protein [Cytophagales bacterium]